jgi:UDP-N-acetylmuramate--alanine ligase
MIGIGGSGMSGIAEVLLNLGYEVSGSDLKRTATIERLEKLGARIFLGHDAKNVKGAEVVVYSSAVRQDNPEIIEAYGLHIPVVPRAEMLAELMRLKYGIAVGGAHGKTTTTSLIASVIAAGGLDPTIVIGGKLNSLATSAKLGTGDFMVVEADESDSSFLMLSPVIVVVTNIDREHMDYYREFENLKNAFIQFINKVPFYGIAVLCGDNPVIREIIPFVKRRYVTYGFSPDNMIIARILKLDRYSSEFEVLVSGKHFGKLYLNIPGRHNVQNALAAISVGIELNINKESINEGLKKFSGIERRFQVKGEKKGIIVVDDYGHHPSEIRAVIQTVKDCWKRQLIMVFQPHRYSRTKDLFKEFHTCFDGVDYLFLTEIYPASEEPIPGVNAGLIWDGVKKRVQGKYLRDKEKVVDEVIKIAKPGDMILTMGAGDIWQLSEEIYKRLGE